ncbi:MAG: arginine--tRNA ligase, partial [Oscillospiraceae bacterium]
MANLIKEASSEMKEIILNALGRLVSEGKVAAEPIPAFNIEIPNDKTNGDFASNVAMVCARTFKLAPKKIAEMICEASVLDGSFFDKFEVAGPGFINFFL